MILEEREKEEEIFKTAWESVKLGQDERTFVSQKIAEWKMFPDLKDMN